MDGTSPHGDGENKINGPSLSLPLCTASSISLQTGARAGTQTTGAVENRSDFPRGCSPARTSLVIREETSPADQIL